MLRDQRSRARALPRRSVSDAPSCVAGRSRGLGARRRVRAVARLRRADAGDDAAAARRFRGAGRSRDRGVPSRLPGRSSRLPRASCAPAAPHYNVLIVVRPPQMSSETGRSARRSWRLHDSSSSWSALMPRIGRSRPTALRSVRHRNHPRSRRAKPEEPPVYEEQVVVTASKVEQQLVNAPATVSVVTADVIAVDAGHQLRRAAALGAGRQPVADLGARLQHHDARRHVDAGHLDAGAARRPQPLSRLLRLRGLGPAAGQSERAAADRSDPRAGVRGVGRQRHERRRQLHLEDAARAERQQRDDHLRHVRPRHRGRQQLGNGSLFGINGTHARAVNDRWAYKISAGGYTSDAFARPTGTIPNGTGTQYPNFTNQGTTQPKFDTRVDYDARRIQAGVRRRLLGHRRHFPHRHRTVRRHRRRRRLRHDALHARRAQVQLLHQPC